MLLQILKDLINSIMIMIINKQLFSRWMEKKCTSFLRKTSAIVVYIYSLIVIINSSNPSYISLSGSSTPIEFVYPPHQFINTRSNTNCTEFHAAKSNWTLIWTNRLVTLEWASIENENDTPEVYYWSVLTLGKT